jgi:hypothetical protein
MKLSIYRLPVVVLALAFSIVRVQAQTTGINLGFTQPKIAILMLPEVKAELKLTKQQDKTLQASLKSQQGGLESMPMSGFGVQGIMGALDSELPSILTPEQLTRLNELWIQHEGAVVLEAEEIAKALKLAEDQRGKIENLVEQFRDTQMEMMQGGIRSQGDMKKLKTLQAESEKKILAVLTEAQLKMFGEMQGRLFKFKG